jgi:hypothetical protein
MPGAGASLLILALALYALGASLYGAHTGRPAIVASARRGTYAIAGVLAITVALLEAAFPAVGLLARARGGALVGRHTDVLQGDRLVDEPGRVPAAR